MRRPRVFLHGLAATAAAAAVVSAALLTLAAAPAAAQEAAPGRWQPQPGDWSLALSLENAVSSPGGGLTLWRQTTPIIALGLDLSVGASVERPPESVGGDNRSMVAVGLGPAVRSYWWSGRSTSPFLLLATRATWSWSREPVGPTESRERVAVGLDGTVGLGVDWLFTERLSLAAHTGITGRYRSAWDPQGERQGDAFSIATGTSRLSLQLYF